MQLLVMCRLIVAMSRIPEHSRLKLLKIWAVCSSRYVVGSSWVSHSKSPVFSSIVILSCPLTRSPNLQYEPRNCRSLANSFHPLFLIIAPFPHSIVPTHPVLDPTPADSTPLLQLLLRLPFEITCNSVQKYTNLFLILQQPFALVVATGLYNSQYLPHTENRSASTTTQFPSPDKAAAREGCR